MLSSHPPQAVQTVHTRSERLALCMARSICSKLPLWMILRKQGDWALWGFAYAKLLCTVSNSPSSTSHFQHRPPSVLLWTLTLTQSLTLQTMDSKK